MRWAKFSGLSKIAPIISPQNNKEHNKWSISSALYWEFPLPLHQTKLLRPAANHCPLPVVIYLWVNWTASAGYRGNYNLAMTWAWLYCLTLWHTCWDRGELKLKAHWGNHSMLPQRALLPTKQSSAKMTQAHNSEKKYLHLFLSSAQRALFVEIPFSMHPKMQNIFSFTASVPFMADWKSCKARRNNFAILLSRYFSWICVSSNSELY